MPSQEKEIRRNSLHFAHFAVSKYTREAGVRTLERRIGAVCRAVAVKVAENVFKQRAEVNQEKTPAASADKKEQRKEKDALVEAAELALPPEMPIIIDEQAVEDILGVRIRVSEI